MGRLLVTDGSSQIYRAYHAMARGAGRALAAPDGTPTGALHAFLALVRASLARHEPDLVAVAFDRPEPTFRHEMFPEYKAQRDAMPEDLAVQFGLAREALSALGFAVLDAPGVEADDIIATLARRAREAGHEVVILTSDKDLMQLVREGVKLHHASKDRVLDEAGVADVFGVPPDRVADVLAIMGDASDNIPGVRGIGEKGARQLVALHGDLETILASTAAIAEDERLGKLRKRMATLLAEHSESARLAHRLVTLDDAVDLDVDLDDLAPRPADQDACTALFGRLGMRGLLEEFGDAAAAAKAGAALADVSTSGAEYRTVVSREDLVDLARGLAAAGRFALDTETDGKDAHRCRLVGISVAAKPKEAAYVPVGHAAGPNADLGVLRKILGPLLASPAVAKVGQNAKFDVEVLARHGLPVEGLAFDTMIASYLLDSSRRSHDLDSLARDHLTYRTIPHSEVARVGSEEATLDRVDVAAVTRYAAEDADVALQLSAVLAPRLAEAGLSRVMDEVEVPLVPVLSRMELAGVKLDAACLETLSARLEARLAEVTSEIHRLAGREFSVNSPKQLAEVLFDELGLAPRGRTAKTGARSTAVEILEQLALEHPLPRAVLEHRELAKLKGTYLDVLPTLVNPETGRVHTSYNQSVASTGRLSSTDPNLQNIPIRTELGREIRRAFVAEDGCLLVGADYSQVELRIMAHLSGDETLCDSFRRGEDIHRRTAAAVFNVMPERVTSEMRAKAKEVNFGVLYGMRAFGLAQRLGCSRAEAQAIIDGYLGRLPRVSLTIERIIKDVREDPRHEARTLLGRARPLPGIVSRSQNERSFAERAAVNAVVQGTAADLIKLAMIRLDRALPAAAPGSRMILQVHDELVLEAPEKVADAARQCMIDAMEHAFELAVPLTVSSGVGRTWHDLA